jgi:hypothetical protein
MEILDLKEIEESWGDASRLGNGNTIGRLRAEDRAQTIHDLQVQSDLGGRTSAV